MALTFLLVFLLLATGWAGHAQFAIHEVETCDDIEVYQVQVVLFDTSAIAPDITNLSRTWWSFRDQHGMTRTHWSGDLYQRFEVTGTYNLLLKTWPDDGELSGDGSSFVLPSPVTVCDMRVVVR